MRTLAKNLHIIGFVLLWLWPMAGLLHVLTIFVAYLEMGAISAVVAAILPGGAEVYWVIRMWWNHGFDTLYVLT